MGEATINREAGDKFKGPRLQKLRAIKLMLETLEKEPNSVFYTAIEEVEDISHRRINGAASETYIEEDKNYDPEVSFTINSKEVLNTLVSFFDIYVNSWRRSSKVRLGFYTTASIGKERKKVVIDEQEINPPSYPLLQTAKDPAGISTQDLKFIKHTLTEEYRLQYQGKRFNGFLDTLIEMDEEEFRQFLSQITWCFEDEDDEELKRTVIDLIKSSELYTSRQAGKANTIFCLLMEMLDERQNKEDLADKTVNGSMVEMEFLKAASEEPDDQIDPVWKRFSSLEQELKDNRNLQEKIISVCPDYPPKRISNLARIACRSRDEQAAGNKTFLSLKYRTYETCINYLSSTELEDLDSAKIDSLFKTLKQEAEKDVDTLKEDYKYTVSNKIAINGLIMDLFDNCFLAFDEVNDDLDDSGEKNAG